MRAALVVLLVAAHCSTSVTGASGSIRRTNPRPFPTPAHAPAVEHRMPRARDTRAGADSTSALQWLLGADMPLARFFAEHWEQAPLLVRRSDDSYYDAALAFSNETFLASVDAGVIRHGVNVHWSRYRKGTRQNKQLPGRASFAVATRLFEQGFTAQMFAPQHFSTKIARLCRRLEGEFLSLVGCSAYLTPPRSQGLAPHHDDIEAFILQVQGRKRWRVYPPHVPLASSHSGDYERKELGGALMDVVLEPGDLLYMPRGTIHEATTAVGGEGEFSTHLTLSTYQMQSWAHLFARTLSGAVERAEEQHMSLRQGLPLGAFHHLGCVHTLFPNASDTHARTCDVTPGAAASGGGGPGLAEGGGGIEAQRVAMQAQAGQLLQVILRDFNASLDAAIDEMAADFVQTRLPPAKQKHKEEHEKEDTVGEGVWVQLRDVDTLRLVTCKLAAEDGGCGGSSEGRGGGDFELGVQLLTSRCNRRSMHMKPGADDGKHVLATLPKRFAAPLALLVRCALRDRWLPLSLLEGGGDGEGSGRGGEGVELEPEWKSAFEVLEQEDRGLLLTVLCAEDLLRKTCHPPLRKYTKKKRRKLKK